MRWRGQTPAAREKRLREWHRRFAFLPVQMWTGEWVWLESYWARKIHKWPNRDGVPAFVCCAGSARPSGFEWMDGPVTPPPPKPRS